MSVLDDVTRGTSGISLSPKMAVILLNVRLGRILLTVIDTVVVSNV